MRRKLPRWTLVSMFIVLGAVAAFQIIRGTTATQADDKTSGPVIPPGGPKPIPFEVKGEPKPGTSAAKPGTTEPWRNRRPSNANLLHTVNDGNAPSSDAAPSNNIPSDEPRRTPATLDESAPVTTRFAPNGVASSGFPSADQSLNKTGVPAANGDPFGLRNAPAEGSRGQYGVRPASSEIPEVVDKGSSDRNVTLVAGNPPIPTDAPAWARDRDPSPSTPNKSPFPPAASKPNPWAADPPAATAMPDPRTETREPRQLPTSPFNAGATSNLGSGSNAANVGSNTLLPTAAPIAATAGDGSGRPGGKQLEGSQAPQVTLEKIAPREIQVGKPAVFEIKVRNTGTVIAQGVEIFDDIPKGTQLLRTVPAASRGPRNDLIWSIGPLKPGEESKVQVEVMPTTEGEVGSVATVHFRADASARTICTKPELTVQVAAPRQVMIGDDVTFSIKISNPGSGVASGVVLSERVPTGLQHAAGTELEFDVGSLKPGETRNMDLTLKAVTPGAVVNMVSARADANLKVTEKAELEVVAPGLKVVMTGPSKRFLGREATYTFSVTNPGTAAAKEIELTTYLPKGMKFVKANNSGQYDPRRNCVVWSLEELPPTETGAVQMTALPIEEGEQKLRIEAKAQQGLADMQESTITVDGVAAVLFEVADLADPIEVGGETTYEVRVTNQGSKAATNIIVSAIMPAEMKPLAAEGPTKHVIEGAKVTFEPLPRLSPKGDTVFRIRAQALRPGDARVKVQLMADELRQPVTKEESTRVYADE